MHVAEILQCGSATSRIAHPRLLLIKNSPRTKCNKRGITVPILEVKMGLEFTSTAGLQAALECHTTLRALPFRGMHPLWAKVHVRMASYAVASQAVVQVYHSTVICFCFWFLCFSGFLFFGLLFVLLLCCRFSLFFASFLSVISTFLFLAFMIFFYCTCT